MSLGQAGTSHSTNFGSWFCPQLPRTPPSILGPKYCHTTQLQHCPPVFPSCLASHWPILLGDRAWCSPQPCSQSCIPSSHGSMLWEQSALQMLGMDQVSSSSRSCPWKFFPAARFPQRDHSQSPWAHLWSPSPAVKQQSDEEVAKVTQKCWKCGILQEAAGAQPTASLLFMQEQKCCCGTGHSKAPCSPHC